MASSSIGMEEVPYATLPFAVDGHQSSIRYAGPQPGFPHDMMLIAGVRSQQDVIRGEETQLIGLISLLGLEGEAVRKAIFIFPGTHSKHMYVQDGWLINFATYMTGELFDLMANHSILKDSVDIGNLTDFPDNHVEAFKLGIRQSGISSLSTSLFTVRTNQLFEKLDKVENAFYLSGLVIGSELNHLVGEKNWPLVLCSGSKLAAFYKLAIDALNLSERTRIIPAGLIDRAASMGQIVLFQHQVLNQTAR
jgi:2-dehydro-3-deoxygalactonokinase